MRSVLPAESGKMGKGLELTLFERFSIGLSLLQIHQRRLGIPSEITAPMHSEGNYREATQISCRLLRDLENLSGWIWALYSEDPALQEPPEDQENAQRLHRSLAPLIVRRIGEFEAALKRAVSVGEGLLNQTCVPQQRFDRLGDQICAAIKRMRRSEGFEALKRLSSGAGIALIGEAVDKAIGDRIVRSRLRAVLQRMLEILRLLEHTEITLRSQSDRPILVLLMVHCYYRCRRLFLAIDDLRRFLPPDSPLEDVLSFGSVALKMEAGRALKKELRQLDQESDCDRFDDRLECAVGILKNGFTQTLPQILGAIDASLESADFLEESPTSRPHEGLHLVEDLKQLQRSAQAMERGPDQVEHWKEFSRRLQLFRQRSIYSLYRRDRLIFEEFERELANCGAEGRGFVAHRLGVYLSTLLAQVDNQNVLTYADRVRRRSG